MKKIYPVLFFIALMLNGFVLNATEIEAKGIEKPKIKVNYKLNIIK